MFAVLVRVMLNVWLQCAVSCNAFWCVFIVCNFVMCGDYTVSIHWYWPWYSLVYRCSTIWYHFCSKRYRIKVIKSNRLTLLQSDFNIIPLMDHTKLLINNFAFILIAPLFIKHTIIYTHSVNFIDNSAILVWLLMV